MVMENACEERKTLVYDNGQEGKGTVSSRGPRCSVGRAQTYLMWEMPYLNKIKLYLSSVSVSVYVNNQLWYRVKQQHNSHQS